MVLSHEHYGLTILPAPNPHDIIWKNVHITQDQYQLRHNVAECLILLGVIFWAAICTALTTFSNLDGLAKSWPWLYSQKDTTAYLLLNDYIAFFIILILMAILPLIFDILARYYEGLKCESEIQKSIMNRYFYFQLANVYVSITAGTVTYSMNEIIDNPRNIINILGGQLPGVSLYFAGLIIVRTFIQMPLELLETWPLIYYHLVGVCTNKKKLTRRELRTGSFADFPMLYGWNYPNLMLVMTIMLAYSCIAPLLMPFCLLFFGSSYFMYKYQLLYVYVNRYQSGGYMFYEVFSKSMISLIGGVVVLLTYLALKQTVITGPFYFLLPLPAIIIYFWRRCETKFRGPSKSPSIHSAVKSDRRSKHASFFEVSERPTPAARMESNGSVVELQETSEYGGPKFSLDLYRQPSLSTGQLVPEPYRRTAKDSQPLSAQIDVVCARKYVY